MDKFDAHINPTKNITLVRENGEKDVFTIHPLPFKYLPKIFDLLRVVQGLEGMDKKSNEDFFKTFNSETIELIQELGLESLKISYPEIETKKLEGFVNSNLFTLLPVVIEVNSFNMNDPEVKKKVEAMDKAKNVSSK